MHETLSSHFLYKVFRDYPLVSVMICKSIIDMGTAILHAASGDFAKGIEYTTLSTVDTAVAGLLFACSKRPKQT